MRNWKWTVTGSMGYDGTMCIETGPFAHGPDFKLEDWKGMVDDTEALVSRALGDG